VSTFNEDEIYGKGPQGRTYKPSERGSQRGAYRGARGGRSFNDHEGGEEGGFNRRRHFKEDDDQNHRENRPWKNRESKNEGEAEKSIKDTPANADHKEEGKKDEKTHDDNYKKRDYAAGGDKRPFWKRDGDENWGKDEPKEEEEDVKGLTLEEFKAQQEAKKRNLAKAQAREHEQTAQKKGNLQQVERQSEKQQQISNQVKEIDTYNTGKAKGENTELLAFQGSDDERRGSRRNYDDGDRAFGGSNRGRGGRGGRGGFRGHNDEESSFRGGQRGSDSRGGRYGGAARRGGHDLLSQKDFPSLNQ